MPIDNGVIDSFKNPFVHQPWIEQGWSFTLHRQQQIEDLFGKSKEYIIETKPANNIKYVAFVAIRWGFALIADGKLTPTEKWYNRHLYNGKGRPITKA